MDMVRTQTTELTDIIEKVQAGERLGFEDGVRLFESHDLLTLGQLADLVNTRRNGGRHV